MGNSVRLSVRRPLGDLVYDRELDKTSMANWVVGDGFAFCGFPYSVTFLGSAGSLDVRDGTVDIVPRPLSFPHAVALLPDRSEYRVGDVVHLGVFAPDDAGRVVQLHVKGGGDDQRRRVEIDDDGLGLLTVDARKSGRYTAALGQGSASWVVAEDVLTALSARIGGWSLVEDGDGVALVFRLQALRWGEPYSGTVKIMLLDVGLSRPVTRDKASVSITDGWGDAKVKLAGDGPFELRVTSRGHEAHIDVPNVRPEAHRPLVLTGWGERLVGRLVDGPGCSEVRGVHVRPEPALGPPGPLELEVVDGRHRIRFREPVDAWRIAVFDGRTGEWTEHAGMAADAGETVVLPDGGTWFAIYAGAMAFGHCWEGSSAVIEPSALTLRVQAGTSVPGEVTRVVVNGPPRASVLLVVRDADAPSPEEPGHAVAAGLRPRIAAALDLVSDGPRGDTLDRMDANVALDPSDQDTTVAQAAPPRLLPKFRRQVRSSFGETHLVTRLRLDATGERELAFRAPDRACKLAVVAMASLDREFLAASTEVDVNGRPFATFELPPFAASDDLVTGRLLVDLARPGEVAVVRDGEALKLFHGDTSAFSITVPPPGGVVKFIAGPGDYVATVGSERPLVVRGAILEPGGLSWLQRSLTVLAPGQYFENADRQADLKVSRSCAHFVDSVAESLVRRYGQDCDATSASLVGASTVWVRTRDPAAREHAAATIVAGVDWLWACLDPDSGLKAQPDAASGPWRYSPSAAFNLLDLAHLQAHDLDATLGEAVSRALELAAEVLRIHRLEPAPDEPKSAREAWNRSRKAPRERDQLVAWVRQRIRPWEGVSAFARFRTRHVAVDELSRGPNLVRAESAWAAALLLSGGTRYRTEGLELANGVLGDFREDGGLHSTYESVAALTLLKVLEGARLTPGRCHVNGAILFPDEAARIEEPIERLGAMDGPLVVEVARRVRMDLANIDSGVQLAVAFEASGDDGRLRPGENLELVVELPEYVAGDVIHVFLPEALRRITGGPDKYFTLDPLGKTELRVPLRIIGTTRGADGGPAPQHFAVCLRNRYDESRGRGRAHLPVLIEADAPPEPEPTDPDRGDGAFQSLWSRLRRGWKS